jgi:DNA-binding MarR family transcriptional regulator
LACRALRELEVVGGKVEALVAGVARRYGLSHAALNALAVIEGNGAPLPAGEVSSRMHITSGTMTTVLDTLERKQYVKRLLDPTDRRRVLVDVTPAGQGLLDEMLPQVQQAATAVMSALGDELLVSLRAALAAVDDSLRALPDDLPRPQPRRTPAHLRRS